MILAPFKVYELLTYLRVRPVLSSKVMQHACYIFFNFCDYFQLITRWSLINYREDANYSDVLPLKAARRDSISNLTSFGALESVWWTK